METPIDIDALRAQLDELQSRLEMQEGQGHALRTILAALIVTHPDRDKLGNTLAIMWADLQTKLDHQQYPHSQERTRRTHRNGAMAAWQAIAPLLDDWLPPEAAPETRTP